jgi:stress-induced morphogen
MKNNQTRLQEKIQSLIPGSHVEVTDLTGTQDHLGVLIVSDIFAGKPLLEQHKYVMGLIKEDLSDYVHAVKLKTLTFEKFKKEN